VIPDAHSCRVIGWALDRTLKDELTRAALRMALSRRMVEPGLVHHSDRGSQYASNDYTDLLKAKGIRRRSNPKRSTATSTAIWRMHAPASPSSWRGSTITSAFTPRSAICPVEFESQHHSGLR